VETVVEEEGLGELSWILFWGEVLEEGRKREERRTMGDCTSMRRTRR
jgi:hypothetical protein